jgi:hypothetical protein
VEITTVLPIDGIRYGTGVTVHHRDDRNFGERFGVLDRMKIGWCDMNIYSNSEVAISNKDRAEIEAIFIELMRKQDVFEPTDTVDSKRPLLDAYGNVQEF